VTFANSRNFSEHEGEYAGCALEGQITGPWGNLVPEVLAALLSPFMLTGTFLVTYYFEVLIVPIL
jgi:hypothetical protein